MMAPSAGEATACIAPYAETSSEIANAARAPPYTSSGIVYKLTLNAETARMLSEIPADAHAALGASGIANVTSPASAQIRQTRVRAATVSMPRFAQRNESQPPA